MRIYDTVTKHVVDAVLRKLRAVDTTVPTEADATLLTPTLFTDDTDSVDNKLLDIKTERTYDTNDVAVIDSNLETPRETKATVDTLAAMTLRITLADESWASTDELEDIALDIKRDVEVVAVELKEINLATLRDILNAHVEDTSLSKLTTRSGTTDTVLDVCLLMTASLLSAMLHTDVTDLCNSAALLKDVDETLEDNILLKRLCSVAITAVHTPVTNFVRPTTLV